MLDFSLEAYISVWHLYRYFIDCFYFLMGTDMLNLLLGAYISAWHLFLYLIGFCLFYFGDSKVAKRWQEKPTRCLPDHARLRHGRGAEQNRPQLQLRIHVRRIRVAQPVAQLDQAVLFAEVH